MTITNANFDKQRFVEKIKEAIKLREQLKQTFLDKGGNPEKITFEGAFWTADSLEEMESKAGHVGVLSTENEDIRSLRELITYGLKGLSAYSKHANALLKDDEDTDAFLQRALAATLDGIVQVSREKVSLLQILEQIRRYMLQTLLPSARRVTIHVGGEDVIVSADCASSVALVVNELVQNALKYAFPSGQAGRIGIELHSGRPLCQLTVWDNGVGFQADRPRPGGAGLELASTIVREKLTGEWSVESGPGGTRISFDFLEQ